MWHDSPQKQSKEQRHIKRQAEQILFFSHILGMEQIALIDT